LEQQLTFGDRAIASTAIIEGSILHSTSCRSAEVRSLTFCSSDRE
jgi:hypothetical protein